MSNAIGDTALFLFRTVLLAWTVTGMACAAADASLPPDSVYHLDIALTDQNGIGQRLADRRGQVQIVTLFYASCPYVCPMTISTLKTTEAKLTPEQRLRLHILMVSLDPQRDSVSALQRLAQERTLDASRWTLARAASGDVRRLAAVLGVQYRQLTDGEFNHSTILVLLDPDGRIVARSTQLAKPDPDFTAAVQRALSAR